MVSWDDANGFAQLGLNAVSSWLQDNGLTFNSRKTYDMLFISGAYHFLCETAMVYYILHAHNVALALVLL